MEQPLPLFESIVSGLRSNRFELLPQATDLQIAVGKLLGLDVGGIPSSMAHVLLKARMDDLCGQPEARPAGPAQIDFAGQWGFYIDGERFCVARALLKTIVAGLGLRAIRDRKLEVGCSVFDITDKLQKTYVIRRILENGEVFISRSWYSRVWAQNLLRLDDTEDLY